MRKKNPLTKIVSSGFRLGIARLISSGNLTDSQYMYASKFPYDFCSGYLDNENKSLDLELYQILAHNLLILAYIYLLISVLL